MKNKATGSIAWASRRGKHSVSAAERGFAPAAYTMEAMELWGLKS